MVKLILNSYTTLAVISPWAYLLARIMGIYNFPHDIFIFLALFIMSILVLFAYTIIVYLVRQ